MPVFTVEAHTALLAFLRERLPGWKAGTLRERLAAGRVRVNGVPVERANQALQPGDAVSLDEGAAPAQGPVPGVVQRAPFGARVLYDDGALLVLEKPSGLLSLPNQPRDDRTALAAAEGWLAARTPRHRASLSAVHRLDRETSGLLLFTHGWALREALQARWTEVEKTYLAIVQGVPQPREGRIDQPLLERPDLSVEVVARGMGESAVTHYRTLSTGKGRALLAVRLETGRKHQIRVHLAWLGHPVLGDPRYNPQMGSAPRLALHAWRLRLPHPKTGAPLAFESPWPPALARLMPLPPLPPDLQ